MKKNYFNYKQVNDKYLLTNDIGRYVFLTKDQFYRFLMDKLESEEEITAALKENYFLYDTSDYDFVEEAGSAFRDYRRNLF